MNATRDTDGPDIPRDAGDDYSADILPIFLAEQRDPDPPTIVRFCGTGFRLARDLLITCWHCVSEPEPERGGYAVAVDLGGRFRFHPLMDLARDAGGADLATARIFADPDDELPSPRLTLAARGTITGSDVWTYGYPLTETVFDVTTDARRFRLNSRLLRGYVTRTFWFDHPHLGEIASYELDMLAPEGLSGAPLVFRPGDSVIGVIYGRHDATLVEEFSSVDTETGAATPEVQRIVSFGLACDTSSLFDLQTPATNGVRLFDHLNQ